MTREERHIAVLNRMLENMDVFDSIKPTEERKRAIKEAIKALEQESILDKIRAEIVEMRSKQNVGVLECLDIIDRYRGEA